MQKNHLLLLLCLLLVGTQLTAQTWTTRAPFGNMARWCSATFAIGTTVYVIGGATTTTTCLNDVWAYNSLTNTWTQKSDFPGGVRMRAVGLSLNGKGYICMGGNASVFYRDLWCYNPVTDTWTQKADFAGLARWSACGFALSGKLYVGTGYAQTGTQEQRDFYSYDPTTDTWTRIADFGGGLRRECVAFALPETGLGYVCTGYLYGNYFNDMWKYNPTTNTWAAGPPFPGNSRTLAMGAAFDDRAIVGLGFKNNAGLLTCYNDVYRYWGSNDYWEPVAAFTGGGRIGAWAAAVPNYLFVGDGQNCAGTNFNDTWQLQTNAAVATEAIETSATATVQALPNPTAAVFYLRSAQHLEEASIRVTDQFGRVCAELSHQSGYDFEFDTSNWASGVYFYTVTQREASVACGKIIVLH